MSTCVQCEREWSVSRRDHLDHLEIMTKLTNVGFHEYLWTTWVKRKEPE